MNRVRKRSGNALLEFAASLIVLSTMFAGIFQIGYAFFTYNTLVNAVRAGARYASLNAPSEAGDKDFNSAVRNIVVYGESTPAAGAQPVVNGLTPENIEVTLSPNTATVSLRDYAVNARLVSINLNGRPTVTFPRLPGAKQ